MHFGDKSMSGNWFREIRKLMEATPSELSKIKYDIIKIYMASIENDQHAQRMFPMLDDDPLSDAISHYLDQTGGYNIQRYREIRDAIAKNFEIVG